MFLKYKIPRAVLGRFSKEVGKSQDGCEGEAREGSPQQTPGIQPTVSHPQHFTFLLSPQTRGISSAKSLFQCLAYNWCLRKKKVKERNSLGKKCLRKEWLVSALKWKIEQQTKKKPKGSRQAGVVRAGFMGAWPLGHTGSHTQRALHSVCCAVAILKFLKMFALDPTNYVACPGNRKELCHPTSILPFSHWVI